VGGSNGIVQILLVSFTLLVSVTIANLIVALVIANMNKVRVTIADVIVALVIANMNILYHPRQRHHSQPHCDPRHRHHEQGILHLYSTSPLPTSLWRLSPPA
jgi:hypothetical protein